MKKIIAIALLLFSTACSAEEFAQALPVESLLAGAGRHATATYTVDTGLAETPVLQVVQFTPMGQHESCVVVLSPNGAQSVSCYMKSSFIDTYLNYIASFIGGEK